MSIRISFDSNVSRDIIGYYRLLYPYNYFQKYTTMSNFFFKRGGGGVGKLDFRVNFNSPVRQLIIGLRAKKSVSYQYQQNILYRPQNWYLYSSKMY